MEDKEFVNLTPETENTVGVSAAENEEMRSADVVPDEKTAATEANGRGNLRDRGGNRPHLKPGTAGNEAVFPL